MNFLSKMEDGDKKDTLSISPKLDKISTVRKKWRDEIVPHKYLKLRPPIPLPSFSHMKKYLPRHSWIRLTRTNRKKVLPEKSGHSEFSDGPQLKIPPFWYHLAGDTLWNKLGISYERKRGWKFSNVNPCGKII